MDLGGYLQFLLALAFVLGLILLSAAALRRFGPGMQGMRRHSGGRRLEVLEVLPLDGRRRLVMVRRDERAHLLLLGANDDRVVESGFDADAPGAGRIGPLREGAEAGGPPPDAPSNPTEARFKRLVSRLSGGEGS
ncbi:MAG: flagellar biosynthetic protein FliO [Marivibrio sp.]|uniref:FliO/MopB family protein n=1 Tax=Marivibrio sp. TaxID=2039719 RepID=UPI0032F092AE